MVTQRIANPCIPVRFRALPPKKILVLVLKKSKLIFLYSSVAQLVEQLTVNQLVAGSSPARGAKKINKKNIFNIFNKIILIWFLIKFLTYTAFEITKFELCNILLNFSF